MAGHLSGGCGFKSRLSQQNNNQRFTGGKRSRSVKTSAKLKIWTEKDISQTYLKIIY